jgi:hypothetical protein
MGSGVGTLRKNDCGRWEIWISNGDPDNGFTYVLTSGEWCEVQIAGYWIRTRIESSNGEYYAVTAGIQLYHGMPARTV